MADQESSAPWTIKAVPVAVREKAVRYARMDGCTMAEWLTKAVETQANRQDGNQVIPPDKPGETALPVLSVGLGEAAAALQSLATAASAGLPVSKTAARETVALIRAHIRVGRGLPPRQTRRQNGQTLHLEHVAKPDQLVAEETSEPPQSDGEGREDHASISSESLGP
jgi:hypothetical protein